LDNSSPAIQPDIPWAAGPLQRPFLRNCWPSRFLFDRRRVNYAARSANRALEKETGDGLTYLCPMKLRFSIRDLLWLTAVCAVLVALLMEHIVLGQFAAENATLRKKLSDADKKLADADKMYRRFEEVIENVRQENIRLSNLKTPQ
jgi:hypothetical protein